MAARCFNDSCSVEWSEVTTAGGPAYQADVQLTPESGSISCVDDEGLHVTLLNEVSENLVDECKNILRRDVNGKLWAALDDAIIQTFSDDTRTAIPADADTTDAPSFVTTPTHTFNNNSGCDQLVIVEGNLLYSFAVLGPASGVVEIDGLVRAGALAFPALFGGPDKNVVPFNAQVYAAVQSGINAAPSATIDQSQISVSGTMENFLGAGEYQYGNERRKFWQAIKVTDGQQLRINSTWAYQGKGQTMNVIAYGSTVFSTLGAYIKDASFIAIPIG